MLVSSKSAFRAAGSFYVLRIPGQYWVLVVRMPMFAQTGPGQPTSILVKVESNISSHVPSSDRSEATLYWRTLLSPNAHAPRVMVDSCIHHDHELAR
eukprot:scaffold172695_cov36-Tisochrysis_lutea.AAC.3